LKILLQLLFSKSDITGLGIRYQILSYEVDPADLAAESTAHKVGLPPEQVFKL
jgi:prolyl-tRNA editing enzyme YbaK/EbsC (Cys-tRNA(Pro) deacylase)